MSTENITNKLDNNKDKKISEEELKNNIAKFDANDWIVLTNELEKKNAELVKLLESPVSKVIKEKKLYNKYNKSVDELKILKLGFLCYNRGSQVRLGTGIDTYCLQYGNNWETYKKNELPKMGILRTGKVDEEWLRMERIDNIKQASDVAVRAGTPVEPVVKPAPKRKPMPVANPTPADAVRESIYVHEFPDVGIVKVDEKENIKEGSIKEILDNITKWARDTYFSEYEACKLEANKRYMKEEEKEKQAYITYELYLFSFSKYCESINGKHNDIISQAGYESMDEFENQMELMKEFQDSIALSLKYDKIGDEMKKFEQYVKEMESNKDKYFKGKSEEDIQNAEEKYTEFQSFQEKKYKEHGITEEILSSMNKIPESSGENQTYWENTEKILQCQIEINQWRQENGGDKDGNGDLIDKYDGYVKGGLKIRDKYSNLDFNLLNDYNNLIESWTSKGLDFKKYGEYASLMQKEGLNSHLKNISLIQSVLMDETNKEFPIPGIRDAAIKKKERQEKIDKIRDKIRYTNETAYYVFTSAASIWNTLLDVSIGVGTSLGAMIYGIFGGKDEYTHQLKRKEKWDNFLKIGQSSSQTAPIYNSKTKSFNFHRDNTISTVSGSVIQMLSLIYGGGAVGKGIAKLGTKAGVAIGEEAIAKVGLFGMSFITQVGSSYEEAIKGGLGGVGAFAYSMFSASIQSGLELISPNEVLLGKGMGLGKELIKNICGNGNKEGIKLVGKYFIKTVGREILEENLQEGLQLAAGNLINDVVNGIWNTGLESDRNPKNFLSTAIITTLTTGITTGFSATRQGMHIFNSEQQQLIGRVSGDQELYKDVMNVLDNSINGNFKIPNVDIESLQELRTTLNNIHSNQNNSSNQNDQQQSHEQLQAHERNDNNNSQEPMRSSNETVELDPEKQDLIERIGSKFHEERRELFKQPDGTYKSKIEQVTDQEWIQQHNGETEVDLTNTSFEDLPKKWRHENLEAAKVVVELVYEKVVNGEEITPEMIEEMASIVHNKQLERNGTEGSSEDQRVPYDQLDENEKIKDRNQVKRAIEIIKQDESSRYFDGQSHKFEVTENQAKNNSKYMDDILNNIEEENQSAKLNELRERIKRQYKQATGQEIELSDEQLFSILDAHEQDGILGELTLGQLKKKVKILSETITDKNVRRFLLEAGFCGKLMDRVKSSLTKSLDYSEHGRYMEQNVDRIVPWSYFTELDFVFRAGQTEFLIEQTGNGGYRVVNLTDYHTYEGGFGSETTIGREGDIPIQSDDYASRQHLRLKIDSDGNVIIRDISSNGTRYFFTDRQVGTQYIWEIEQQYKENGGKNGNDRYEENGYKIGEEVNIPRSNGRVTRAIITEYNPQTGEYRVEWSEDGKNCHKDVTKEQLDSVNNEGYEGIQEYDDRYEENGYKIGEEVNIPRSNGRVTKATITAYNPQTGEYRVEWSEDGKNCHKDVTKEQLDSVNNEGHEGIQEYDNDGIAISGNNEKSERGVNTERKEMSEVHRNSDVVAIGDLHGSYAALKGNLEYAGLAVEVGGHLQWTGGSSKVVFQGDILADRGTDGLRIINEIHSLREQARNEGKGGDIDIIVGNHDDFMISYLTQRNGINDNGVEQAEFYTSDQGLGLSELVEKYYTGEKYYKNIKTSEGTVVVKDYEKMLKKGYNNILSNMRNSSEGRILLEEICNMKLVSQVDDVLYLHTNPTDRIMELLITGKYNGPILYEGYEIGHVDIQISNGNTTIQENIDIINNMYQGYLKKTLLGQNIPSVSKRVFNGISDIFLNTGNRDDQMHNIQQYSYVLKDSGINMISHGHNGGGGYRDGFTNGGVRIVDTDHSYGKRGNTNKEHSVSVVKKEGGQVLIGDDVVNGNITHDSNQVIDADNPVNVDNPADMDITKEKQKDTQDNEQEIVSEIYLTPQEKQNIENLKKRLDKLGIDITSEDIYFIKNKEFTPEQWENLKILKSELDKLGITMTAINAVILADFKLTSKQWENVKNLKSEMDQLGIIVDATIVYFKNTILTEDQIRNIRDTKNKMDDYGINENISISDITYLMDNQLTYSQVGDIYKIKKETGIDIPPRAINDIINQSLTEEQINNLKKIKIDLEGIGIEVNARHIEYLKNITLTQEQISNLKKMKADLEGVGIKIFAWNVEFLKDITLTSQQIENLKIIRDGVGIDIYGPDILNLKDMKLTPEQIEDIKRIENETGIHITAENIKVIVDNADILGVANNNPYEGYNRSKEEIEAHQRYTRGRIIETIQQEVQELIPENRDITENEIKYKIRTDLITLPKSERLQILNSISQIVQKFNTVRKYIDFENGPYKDKYPNAKALLCAMVGITDPNIIEKVSDNITVIQYGTGLSFFVGDQDSFDIVYNNGQKNEDVAGFNSVDSKIEELKNTLSVIKKDIPEQILSISQGKAKTNDLISIERRLSGKDPYANDWVESRLTVIHEGQHNRNSYFMVDKGGEKITRAKDEIIAYLREGKTIKYIEKLLTSPKDEGGYQYGLEGEARENHKKQVKELLSYANDLIELTNNKDSGLTRDKVINILTYAPVNGWKDLHANITEAVKLHLEREISESKIVKLKDRFIAKMQEWAGNNILLNNLIDFWNNIFPKHGIHLESFWWAGTAEKHNVIDEIGQAESLEEIKYILNNPKYSHIQRGPNNKGGIEISAIIDKVVTGEVEIDFIPSEIRPIVHNFIN